MSIDKYLELEEAFVYTEYPDDYLLTIDKISLIACLLLRLIQSCEKLECVMTLKNIIKTSRTESDVQILKDHIEELRNNGLITIRETQR